VRRRGRQLGLAVGLCGLVLLCGHPSALGASDLWGNVAPASPLGSGALFGRYPLANYALDQHFSAISASLTGGVDADGLLPMMAYFLASLLWALTSFLATALITLFAFAFSLDLVNGSEATGGAGALGPVARAIHSLYGSVFGQPWLVLAVALAGIWAMWRALVQRRYVETVGALALSLIYVVCALFFVAQPGATIGAASGWANKMSQSFLAISKDGSPTSGGSARDAAADQLFELLVFRPWVVLEFGGLEHCVVQGTGGEDSDPISAPVRPLASDPARDAQLARRLRVGAEVSAEGKQCINDAAKYARRFLRFGPGTEERDAEYEALDDGDTSELPDADRDRGGYRLGPVDRPATDAMEQGGQFQRFLLALVVFAGELGAFCLLGALSLGVILAQVLLLLLLAFAPVALVAAAIPGRGHAFFRGWLEKLAGYLLRKAAYSLVLAVLLAVNGAIAEATSAMGWLMSFGLQALFFWAVFLQRRALTEGLVGIATGPGAPAREGTLRLLALYGGARTVARPLQRLGRGSQRAASAPKRPTGRPVGRSQGDTGHGTPAAAASAVRTREASKASGLPSSFDSGDSGNRLATDGDRPGPVGRGERRRTKPTSGTAEQQRIPAKGEKPEAVAGRSSSSDTPRRKPPAESSADPSRRKRSAGQKRDRRFGKQQGETRSRPEPQGEERNGPPRKRKRRRPKGTER
jgi:hypothetical protein